MKTMDAETIKKLMSELDDSISPWDVYDEVNKYMDLEKLKGSQPLTSTELAVNYAYVGFRVGVKFALDNLEMIDE